ncbi:Shedu anti-phage system protein SduA domain-containing protein, partial [Phormidesmis sp. 146-12]
MQPIETNIDETAQKYVFTSSSPDSSDFQPFLLTNKSDSDNPQTRYILHGHAVNNSSAVANCLKITLSYQRKHNKTKDGQDPGFSNLETISRKSISAGQEMVLKLSSLQTAELYHHLQGMYEVASEGITIGTSQKVVLTVAESNLVANLATEIVDNSKLAIEILNTVRGTDQSSFDTVALLSRHQQRHRALKVFEKELTEQNWKEGDWEKFFNANPWIFGLAMDYHFLSEVESQPHYGGGAVTGRGTQKGDHLMSTPGAARFTVLVEVKKPQTELLGDKYRNGAYLPSEELAGGTAQLTANCRTWDTEGATAKANKYFLYQQQRAKNPADRRQQK